MKRIAWRHFLTEINQKEKGEKKNILPKWGGTGYWFALDLLIYIKEAFMKKAEHWQNLYGSFISIQES